MSFFMCPKHKRVERKSCFDGHITVSGLWRIIQRFVREACSLKCQLSWSKILYSLCGIMSLLLVVRDIQMD